jgi:Ca-activated chloride channel family protein
MWEHLSQFHFIRPYWLLGIVPLAIVMWLYAHRRLKAGNWSRVCDERLLPFILIGQQQQVSAWRIIAIFCCGMLLILALAGPTWVKLPQPVFRSQAALVIALDLSRSMDVADIKPSRIARARHKILDILNKRREGQTALIVYAAEPFVVTPLTEDTNTVATLVKDLTTDLMPYQGSYPDKALRKAADLFKQASIVNGHVLLITDGVDVVGMDEAVSQLTESGYQLSVLGIGTEQGAPIADHGGGFVKDASGSIVLAQLDEPRLRQIALAGQGIYRQITVNDRDINDVLDILAPSRLQDDFGDSDDTFKLHSDQWREEGPWLVLLLLPFVALAFRRGYLAVLLVVLLPMPQPGYALDWSSLWKNQDQQAATAMEQGDAKKAAKLFNDPEWKAAASYRAGDYQQAIEALDGVQHADALYNKGNALAKAGDLQQAIEAYNQALNKNPQHEDAQYNRDLIQRFLEQQQEQQQQQQNNNQSQNDEQNQQSQQSQQEQSQQQSSQEQQSDDQQQGSNSEDQQQNSQSSTSQQEQNEQQARQDAQQQQAENAQSNQDKEEQQQAEAAQQAEQDKEQKEDPADATQSRVAQGNDDLNKDPESMRRTEQWLRRIPDDPGGLLRRKFRYQSQLNQRQAQGETKPW